jgi:hypothetical protein
MNCAEGARTVPVAVRAPRVLLAAMAAFGLAYAGPTPVAPGSVATQHYAPNRNFDRRGAWLPATAGFTLADVSDPRQLRNLPRGVKGLVWVGLCAGADQKFVAAVTPYLREKNVFGFYLMDDPDPRSGRAQCRPDALRAESDWIHEHAAGAPTVIVLMNLATADQPSFQNTYSPANSHVDLYGIDPYPCRSELNGCDYDMITRFVLAAEAWGIPRTRMIPVFQAFGGGSWNDGAGGAYLLPTAVQLHAMLVHWRALVPAPRFDFAYSWGVQRGDHALEDTPALREVFAVYNKN